MQRNDGVGLDAFLASLSDDEKAEVAMQRKHAFSVYSINGDHYPHADEREELLYVLSNRECYVVDSNSDWQKEAAKPENKEKAFVIGRTVTDEQWNRKAVFFGKQVNITNNNLFILAPEDIRCERVICLHRLDEYYRCILDEQSLTDESRPIEQRESDISFKLWQKDRFESIEQEKRAILLLLGLRDISDLKQPKDLSKERGQVFSFVQAAAPRSMGHYRRAVEIARHCYLLLLIERRDIRTAFSNPDDINVLNDTFLLQNAVFLGAGIMTHDRALKRMARYAGLKMFPFGT
jgi:hypothetical protein